MRRAFSACIHAALVGVTLLAPATVWAEAVQVQPGSLHHQNIETAIKFLRDHGEAQAADQIQKALDGGKLYVDPELKENGETSALNNITLTSTVAGHTLPRDRNRALDPDRDFQAVLELARTLFHENVHASQQAYWEWVISGVAPGNMKERSAWRRTLNALERWIQVERDRFDPFYRHKTAMSPAAETRELRKIQTKIRVLTTYFGSYKDNNYFGANDGRWATSTTQYWQEEQATYIQPRVQALTSGPQPQTGTLAGGTPAPPKPSAPPPPPPKPAPQPVAVQIPPCDPCRPIADEIARLRAQIRQIAEQADKARNDLADAEQQFRDLEKRVQGLERELQRSAGTGASSYDPSTGIRVDAWDQGNGAVRVTTRDAGGKVIDEYTRDASQRKAEVARRLDETRAEMARAQAEMKTVADALATAEKAANELTRLLEERVAALDDCIRTYCTGLSVAEALNMLGLPFPDLDMLANPMAFNPVAGPRNTGFQIMVIEWRAGAFGVPVPQVRWTASRGSADAPSWLQPRGALAALLSLIPRGLAAQAGARTSLAGRQAVQVFLSSLGTSTGEAFDAHIVNASGRPLRLTAGALVVEAVQPAAQRDLQRRLEDVRRASSGPFTTRLDGYCLEFARQVPTAGTMFRVAGADLQQRFAPVGDVLEAARQVAGQMRPDSNPVAYLNAIRQYAIWTKLEGWDEAKFAASFLERTKKNAEAAKVNWTPALEAAIKNGVPNRWRDIQTVLTFAQRIAPRR
jgi:flagellar motility protein MotE (MotC chaperone)